MSAEIQRGRNGLGGPPVIEPSCPGSPDMDLWRIEKADGTLVADSDTPGAWYALDSLIGVPLSADLGDYRVKYWCPGDHDYLVYYVFTVTLQQNWGCSDGECSEYGEEPPEGMTTFASEEECVEACSIVGIGPICVSGAPLGYNGTYYPVPDPSSVYDVAWFKTPDQYLLPNNLNGNFVLQTGPTASLSSYDFLGPSISGSGGLPYGTYTPVEEDGDSPIVSEGICTSGRFICNSETGACTYDPTAEAPTGFATPEECFAACVSGSSCTLTGSLEYERVSGNQFRVTSTASGATGAPTHTFSTSSSGVPNDTADTCLVSVLPGTTLNVRRKLIDDSGEPCAVNQSITIDGDTETGTGTCTLDVRLRVIDLGDGNYQVIAYAVGATGAVTFNFFDGLTPLTSVDNAVPIHLEYGQSTTINVAAFDGTCPGFGQIDITNGDSDGGGIPENPLPDDCVSSLGVRYRDVKAIATLQDDEVIYKGDLGLEIHSDCTNSACECWIQLFDCSDETLFREYTEEATLQMFPVKPLGGAKWDASGARIARYQVTAHPISRPATEFKFFRIKSTPVYQKVALPTSGDVIKIRDGGARSLITFEMPTAKVRRWTAPPEGTYGAGTLEVLVDLTAMDATDATDAAVVSDKAYVIAPGEIFVVDLSSGEQILVSGIRGETRAPVFVENVGGKPLVIYQDNAATPKTRCYDFTFPAPKLVWSASYLITKTQVADGKLLLAADDDLYVSAGGTATPVLEHAFPTTINALAVDYVGLSNNTVWRKKSTGWAVVESMVGPVGALWPWFGGADTQRALAGAYSGTDAEILRAEQTTLNWQDDIELTGATGVRSMRALSVELTAATETQPAINDEWMLIGDDNSNLWVYSRSPLSEADGALRACDIAAPRLFPKVRRKREGE